MLVKSTCKRSRGVVAMIGCRGALDKPPSCCKLCMQVLMDCHIWLVIPSHQKHSCNRDRVQLQPWCPASLWHLFRVATQCAFGTTKSSRSSFLPLGIECTGIGLSDELWSSVDSTRSVGPPHWRHALLKVSSDQSSFGLPASLRLCSALDLLSGLLSNQSHAFGLICPVATQTSCSKSWSPSAMVGSWTSTQCAAPRVIPLRMDLIHVWVKVGSNPAQHICYGVICVLFGTLTGSWTLQGLQPIGDQWHWRLGVIMI